MTNAGVYLPPGRSLNQENTTTKVGRATIRRGRNNEGVVRELSLFLEAGQYRHRDTSGVRNVGAVLRRHSRRIHDQRTIFHHPARSGSERRHTFRLLHPGDGLLFWLLSRAAVMRMCRVTTFARLYRVRGIVLSGHRGIAATEKTAASHPDRDADRQQQSHRFVREEQTHSVSESTPGASICRDLNCIKIVIKFQHFCNRCLASLNIGRRSSGEHRYEYR